MSIKAILMVILCIITIKSSAQINLTPGRYTIEDGYYTVTINIIGDELTLIEPNRTSVYNRIAGNIFQFIHPTNKIDYRIEVMDPSTIQTFKPDPTSGRFTLKLNSKDNTATNEQFKTYFAIAEKYKALMTTDKKDAQLWSFCAAAAVARSSMNEDGFNNYAKKIVSSIKLIAVDKSKCPCEDAIPSSVWQSTN